MRASSSSEAALAASNDLTSFCASANSADKLSIVGGAAATAGAGGDAGGVAGGGAELVSVDLFFGIVSIIVCGIGLGFAREIGLAA